MIVRTLTNMMVNLSDYESFTAFVWEVPEGQGETYFGNPYCVSIELMSSNNIIIDCYYGEKELCDMWLENFIMASFRGMDYFDGNLSLDKKTEIVEMLKHQGLLSKKYEIKL